MPSTYCASDERAIDKTHAYFACFQILSYIYPYHFLHQDIISQLINFLSIDEEYVVPYVLSVLTFLGKYKPLSELLFRVRPFRNYEFERYS